ncbi:MAG TPA: hypothetical protein VMY37_36190 [Thermoguttaceae bacterium]|nr:hypothetical protein [Thermoguttaceae bacterium]
MPATTTKKKTKRATARMTPRTTMPASKNGDGHAVFDTQKQYAVTPNGEMKGGQTSNDNHADFVALISAIQEDYILRRALIRSQRRLNNQCRAFVRRVLGWRMDLPESEEDLQDSIKERNRINKEAKELITAIQGGQTRNDNQPTFAASVRGFCITILQARSPLDREREHAEQRLRKHAEQLPAWEWVKGVHGMGSLGLAIIIGEAGDLGNYANPGKLWKRLGLAPPSTYDMIKNDGTPGRCLPRQRRSAIWTIGDSLIRSKGDYKSVYDERKAYEKERDPDMTKMHAHRRSQRYMEKRVIRNLWREWTQHDRPIPH